MFVEWKSSKNSNRATKQLNQADRKNLMFSGMAEGFIDLFISLTLVVLKYIDLGIVSFSRIFQGHKKISTWISRIASTLQIFDLMMPHE